MTNKLCPNCRDFVKVGERCACSPSSGSQSSKKHPSRERKFREKKKKVAKRDNHECKRCVIKFGKTDETTRKNLQCHHIKSWRDYPELAYDESNLITVCRSCNSELGNSNKLDFPWKVPEKTKYVL